MVYNSHSQYTQAGGRSPPNGQRLVEWSTPHQSHSHHSHTSSSASSTSSACGAYNQSANHSSSSSSASSTVSQSDSMIPGSAMAPGSRCLHRNHRCFRLTYIVYMLAGCMVIQTAFFLAYHMGLGGSHVYGLVRRLMSEVGVLLINTSTWWWGWWWGWTVCICVSIVVKVY